MDNIKYRTTLRELVSIATVLRERAFNAWLGEDITTADWFIVRTGVGKLIEDFNEMLAEV